MSKSLYNEDGSLSEEGIYATHPLKMALYKLLNQNENIKQLEENELRDLGGTLQKIVADAICERIKFKNEVNRQLAEMNDNQLAALLQAKYGKRWMFQTLTPEELSRVSKMVKE